MPLVPLTAPPRSTPRSPPHCPRVWPSAAQRAAWSAATRRGLLLCASQPAPHLAARPRTSQPVRSVAFNARCGGSSAVRPVPARRGPLLRRPGGKIRLEESTAPRACPSVGWRHRRAGQHACPRAARRRGPLGLGLARRRSAWPAEGLGWPVVARGGPFPRGAAVWPAAVRCGLLLLRAEVPCSAAARRGGLVCCCTAWRAGLLQRGAAAPVRWGGLICCCSAGGFSSPFGGRGAAGWCVGARVGGVVAWDGRGGWGSVACCWCVG